MSALPWRLSRRAAATSRWCCDCVAGDARQRAAAALVAERGLRDGPALAELADLVGLLHARIGHEDLAELRGAGDLLERAHVDAGLAHVHEEARDALVLGHLGVGAGEEEPPVGDGAARRPDLLTVDDEVVARVDGAGLERGEVGAGIGLGIELAPQLLRREDLPEVARLLRVGAVDHDGGPDDAEAEAIGGRGRVHPRHLVGHDGLLHRPRAGAPDLLRPAHAQIARLVELAMPPAPVVERPDLLARQVLFEPGAHLLPVGDVLGGVVQVHAASLLVGVEPGSSTPGERKATRALTPRRA